MGSLAYITPLFVQIIALISLLHSSSAARHLTELVREDPQLLHYHKGSLLYGNISVNLIWYGDFKPSQRAIIVDFISSLSSTSSPKNKNTPSVSDWWKITEKYYHLTTPKRSPAVSLSLGKQIVDRTYSLGKSLTMKQIVQLASRGAQRNAINIVLTAQNVAVEGFCMSRCGTHGSSASRSFGAPIKRSKFAYIWVGDSETQCPGQCAWPFHQPIYGPQVPPLVAPNGDVGFDGIVMNLAGLLAGTATNPFGNGFFQGEAGAPLEAASACPGMFGSGSYPGNPGKVLVDSASGGSYNALGVNGRKYMLPALYDPTTSSCSTLV